MLKPLSPTSPACYGMAGCPNHATCARYQAVETTSPDHTQATCSDARGGWPDFSRVERAEAATEPSQRQVAA